MPAPKFVIAVGSCGITGGAFHGCYNIVGDIGDVIPVDVYVPAARRGRRRSSTAWCSF